ncbi:rhodanese-like domain-containing protein [Nitratifractor sp.]
MKKFLSILMMAGLVGLMGTAAYGAEEPAKKQKQTPQKLYLTPKEAYDMIQKDPKHILFVDVRTPAELLFVGHPVGLDKNIPFKYIDYSRIVTTKKGKKKFASWKNPNLVQQFDEALKVKGLTKNDPVIVICRSGDRSGMTATKLYKAGYKKAYTIVTGFEGDMNKKTHRRDLNGWKNAGLPWTYKFQPELFIPKPTPPAGK